MTAQPIFKRLAGILLPAVGLLGGCSLSPFSESGRHADAPEAVAKPAAPVIVAAEPAAPAKVNVFGEFDGAERRPVAVSNENGFQQHTAADEGYDADASVDPTGKWLVFASTRHSEHADIYLQRIDGTSVIQLTSDPADDVQPTFSPDGKRIAFASTRSGNWHIYVMDLDGKNLEQVTNTSAHEMHPSFSPEGNRLAYCGLSPRNDQWELWTIDLATHERKVIGQGLFPTWSPAKDVDRIAFQRAKQRGSRAFSLWTVDLVEGEPRRLTEVVASSNAAIVSPAWSRDGSRLAFTTIIQPGQQGAEKAATKQDVWTVFADGTGRQRLTEGSGSNLSPFWSVDNRIYFVSDRGGHENIWSVRADPGTKTATAARPADHGINHDQTTAKAPAAAGHGEKPAAVGATDVHEIGR